MALIMPAVTVWSRPNGFPTAITQSPTSILLESPNVAAWRPVASILISARSVSGSVPISLASYSAGPATKSLTVILPAPLTT